MERGPESGFSNKGQIIASAQLCLEDEEYRGARSLYQFASSDVDTLGSTRSLYDGEFDYYVLNSRKFTRDYFLPIDEEEIDRWSMMHSVYFQSLNDSHTTVPLDNPERVLDVGCGKGDWALDIGEQYPDAKVTGSDIAPLQNESAKVPNVEWEIDDAEMHGGWAYSEKFDFIHFRTMKGAFKDWDYVYGQVYNNLVPGGWVEIVDFENYDNILSRLDKDPWLTSWYQSLMDAIAKSPRPFSSAHLEPELLLQQGFEEVTTEIFPIPIGAWGDTESERTNAKVFLKLQMNAVQPLCLRFLYDYGGWSLDQINAACERVRNLMSQLGTDSKLAKGCTLNVKVLKGRKPQNRTSMSDLTVPEILISDAQSVSTITMENFKDD